MKYMFIVRWIFSIALCYGVYSETGKWTTIAIILGFVTIEFQTYIATRKKL
jgi:hypothetical protein